MRLCAVLFAATVLTVPSTAVNDPVSIARTAFDLLMTGKYADLRGMFTQQMLDNVSEDMLRNQLGPQLKAFGAVKKVGDAKAQTATNLSSAALTVVVIPVDFEAGNFDFQLSLNESGKLAGLFLRPRQAAEGAEAGKTRAWSPPEYIDSTAFVERDVTIGEGEWKLPGTLSIPKGAGPFPAVVLVHGSGPQDRDETVSANKPFRDLAGGLASRGVVVLRYEKRTRVYGPQMASLKNLTVQQETIDDAIKAVQLLRQQREVDPKRVFVLGHSLGGYLAPRIAEQEPQIAGVIILAGSVRPMEDLILEQTEYLGLTGAQLNSLKQQVAKIKQLQRGQTDGSPILNVPPSYWLDLRGYDPALEAQKLHCQMFILQGGRDYQVTKIDFDLWRAALSNQKKVTFHWYPALNHLFIAGEGKSLPAEYDKPGHVAVEVIDDIATWVKPSRAVAHNVGELSPNIA